MQDKLITLLIKKVTIGLLLNLMFRSLKFREAASMSFGEVKLPLKLILSLISLKMSHYLKIYPMLHYLEFVKKYKKLISTTELSYITIAHTERKS